MNKENVVIQKAKNGQGIFANRDFRIGETIYEVLGEIVPIEIMDKYDGVATTDNCFRFDESNYINPAGQIGWFQNHSCVPNSKAKKTDSRLFIEAIKDIETGDEILIDFSTIVVGTDPWRMECNCGERECRGRIGKFNDLPEELQAKYLQMNIVPDYIITVSRRTMS